MGKRREERWVFRNTCAAVLGYWAKVIGSKERVSQGAGTEKRYLTLFH